MGRIDREKRFEAMFRRYERRLLGYALRRASVELAKDAVADTFLVAWRRLDELPEDPLPWLVAATRRTLANQRRSAARQERLVERLAPADDGSDLGAAAETLTVRAAFKRLTADDREVLALVAWDGLTPTQAAGSLGCSPVTFRVRLHRARRRLDAALREASGDRPGWQSAAEEAR